MITQLVTQALNPRNTVEHTSGDLYFTSMVNNSNQIQLWKSTSHGSGWALVRTYTASQSSMDYERTYCTMVGDKIHFAIWSLGGSNPFDIYHIEIDVTNANAPVVTNIAFSELSNGHRLKVNAISDGTLIVMVPIIYTSMGQDYEVYGYARRQSGGTWGATVELLEESLDYGAISGSFELNNNVWCWGGSRFGFINGTALIPSAGISTVSTNILDRNIAYTVINGTDYLIDAFAAFSTIYIDIVELVPSPNSMAHQQVTNMDMGGGYITSAAITAYYDATTDLITVVYWREADVTTLYYRQYEYTNATWLAEQSVPTGLAQGTYNNIGFFGSAPSWTMDDNGDPKVTMKVRLDNPSHVFILEHTISATTGPELEGNFLLPKIVVVGSLDKTPKLVGSIILPKLTVEGYSNVIKTINKVVGTLAINNKFEGITIDPQDEFYFLEFDNGEILKVPLIWFTIRKNIDLNTEKVKVNTVCNIPENYREQLSSYVGSPARIYKSISDISRDIVIGTLFSVDTFNGALHAVLESFDFYGGSVVYVDKLLFMKMSAGNNLVRIPPKSTINVGDTVIVGSAIVFASRVVTHISGSQSFTEVS